MAVEQNSGPGWTPADERRLGDHMQHLIDRDGPLMEPAGEPADDPGDDE